VLFLLYKAPPDVHKLRPHLARSYYAVFECNPRTLQYSASSQHSFVSTVTLPEADQRQSKVWNLSKFHPRFFFRNYRKGSGCYNSYEFLYASFGLLEVAVRKSERMYTNRVTVPRKLNLSFLMLLGTM